MALTCANGICDFGNLPGLPPPGGGGFGSGPRILSGAGGSEGSSSFCSSVGAGPLPGSCSPMYVPSTADLAGPNGPVPQDPCLMVDP